MNSKKGSGSIRMMVMMMMMMIGSKPFYSSEMIIKNHLFRLLNCSKCKISDETIRFRMLKKNPKEILSLDFDEDVE